MRISYKNLISFDCAEVAHGAIRTAMEQSLRNSECGANPMSSFITKCTPTLAGLTETEVTVPDLPPIGAFSYDYMLYEMNV